MPCATHRTRARVILGAKQEGEHIRLFVRDTGPGIPEEALPRLGEPFYRPDAARARRDGGTGLGLAICKQIAERHGSTLVIASEPGQGTEVSLCLKRVGHGVDIISWQ
ncbi:MAG: sensor histidine kinase [Armatimonas sp.]